MSTSLLPCLGAGAAHSLGAGNSGMPSLLNQLAAYYALDDASGADASGNGNNLTWTNNPAIVPGRVNHALNMGGTAYGAVAANATLNSGGKSLHLAGWAYWTTLNATDVIASKADFNGTTMEWLLYKQSNNIVTLQIKDSGGTFKTVTASTFGALAINTWYFLDAYLDLGKLAIGVGVNGLAHDTLPITLGTATTVRPLVLGGDALGTVNTHGYLDEWGYWLGRVLTPAEIAHLYSGGAGTTYPF